MESFTVARERVTWIRWDARRLRDVTSHPWQYVVTEPDGCQHFFDRRSEADAWIASEADAWIASEAS